MSARVRWAPVIERAAALHAEYDTLVTLRQLYYRLVSEALIANTTSNYKNFSRLTAAARRAGEFPRLFDKTRTIYVTPSSASLTACLADAVRDFRLDRTRGQAVTLVLGIEKDGLVELLRAWFDDFGLPVVATRGYSSQGYVDDVTEYVERRGRPAVLLYAGDLDPSGEDIGRDFVERTGCWSEVRRVALSVEQVVDHDLPVMVGKASDSRAASFVERHGRLVQVEVDALPPPELRAAYTRALSDWWDDEAYTAVLDDERRQLDELAEQERP